MQVVVYCAKAGGIMYECTRITAESLADARSIIRVIFRLERELPEWNIRSAYMTLTAVEAHIYGYGRDEHVAIILEEDGKCDYLTEEWYDEH